MIDSLGAFIPESDVNIAGAADGPLRGVTFAAKDIYDIAGHVTGCGNPDWARSHEAATATAPTVQRLLDAGAYLVGKTITDELAYSLNGQNHHYGTPSNINAPGRIPGGSSSGSASAVAGGLVDTALGSDTGGSIRTPASYCGLFGLRPTHGRISLENVMPLAPSFDTVGWFARDAELLRRVGEVLFQESAAHSPPPTKLVIVEDAFELAEDAVRSALAPFVTRLEARLTAGDPVLAGEPGGGLSEWMWRFRKIQASEIWKVHGAWIEAQSPAFGAEVAERFAWAKDVDPGEVEEASAARIDYTRRLEALVPEGTLLCLPSTPGIAPLVSASAESLLEHRGSVLSLNSIAGLSGLPQITMPLATVSGCPVGLSLIAGRNADMALLAFAESFTREAADGAFESQFGI
ncbi:amidase [Denitrobaculum tricleocarpae]|uniref:Amidase n=1 Tax=Denitrobaculum tricleocarpae TaxID=2591009 RepID=A0A545TXG5_9PROT|nr:amidase [Denitrobaculum tricleocarpae]TQV81916.1 amidase [Denitrobaculum tricleocarpae]